MVTESPLPNPTSSAKIVFRNGPLRGSVLAIENERVSIGRDPRNDVAIADGIISGFHAAIVQDEEGGFWLEDAGSKNGTFLNGEPIQRERLRDGDVFYLCQTGPEVQFTLGEPRLPGILESATATYTRTGSVARAVRELLPGGKPSLSSLLRVTGVRRILDYHLEEVSRRSRIRSLAMVGAFFLLSIAALAGTVYVQLSGPGAGLARTGTAPDGWDASRHGARAVGDPDAGARSGAAAGGRALESDSAVRLDVEIEPIFGSLFLSYRDSPIGRAEVTNGGAARLTNGELRLEFLGDAVGFLVEPFATPIPDVPPGSTVPIPMMPKLSRELLLDQTREVSVRVSVLGDAPAVPEEEGTRRGGAAESASESAGEPRGVAPSRKRSLLAEATVGVFVHGRHVFSWEFPERIAAFVDPQDPAIQEFLHAVWAHRPPSGRQEFPPSNVVGALTLLTGLADLGLRYLPDSKNPISARIDARAMDSVKYPGETLLDRAGDCDDLSVLSCAVLEAAGIPTALVIGAGHVFFMVDTGVHAAELAESPLDPTTIVVLQERVWMPVEATDFARPGANFASAWSAAWHRTQAISAGEYRVLELREAHRTYQPMNPPPDERTRDRIDSTQWTRPELETSILFGLESLRKLFLENLASRVQEIESSLGSDLERAQATGLVYARSGLFDEARRVFQGAVTKLIFAGTEPGFPLELQEWASRVTEETAFLLADLAFCITLGGERESDYRAAAQYAELALAGIPPEAEIERGELMLRLALVHRLSGDLSAERSWRERAFELDPGLESTYEGLVASGGSVAGPDDKVLGYLRRGFR